MYICHPNKSCGDFWFLPFSHWSVITLYQVCLLSVLFDSDLSLPWYRTNLTLYILTSCSVFSCALWPFVVVFFWSMPFCFFVFELCVFILPRNSIPHQLCYCCGFKKPLWGLTSLLSQLKQNSSITDAIFGAHSCNPTLLCPSHLHWPFLVPKYHQSNVHLCWDLASAGFSRSRVQACALETSGR